jgi:phage tail-like protein
MTTDFGALLYESLPGLYRDKDADGTLRRFLELAALPLAEIERSIDALLDDFFVTTCQPELIPLIGELVGAEVDAGLPARAQRAQVQDAVRFHRSKGRADPLRRYAEQLTAWRVITADMSQRVALAPFIETALPVQRLRAEPVGELPPGSGRFFFWQDRAERPLFDAITGRAITRSALAAAPATYAGVDGRFPITDRGRDLFTGPTPYAAVAANLGDFTAPRTPTGTALAVQAGQIAVDPALARFLVGGTPLLAGNLRVTFQALAPGTLPTQTLALRDPSQMRRLGRSDDRVPTTLDLRAPRSVTDRTGLHHFDNHGLFCTPSSVVANRRPNALGPGSASGRFTFDDRPLPTGDLAGVSLQLLDGVDGAPLTRMRLSGSEALFAGTPRGFSIRIRGVDVSDPRRSPRLRVRAANLTDFAQPRDTAGAALTLAGTDVAVDPQLGRFRMDLATIGATAEDVRVDYLVGLTTAVAGVRPRQVDAQVSELFAFGPDDERSAPRDAFDGTAVADALRLGRGLADYHGTARGWRIRLDGNPVTLPAAQLNLDSIATAPPAGTLAVDPARGRFRFPAGTPVSAARLSVDYAFSDPDDVAEHFASLAQHLPRALPAGVVPVITDTRRRPPDVANLT